MILQSLKFIIITVLFTISFIKAKEIYALTNYYDTKYIKFYINIFILLFITSIIYTIINIMAITNIFSLISVTITVVWFVFLTHCGIWLATPTKVDQTLNIKTE